MDLIQHIAIGAGLAWGSGLRLYAVVFLAGLLAKFGVITLPHGLHLLTHPLVMGVSGTLFVLEFFADKIPGFDSIWDAIHTFVRAPAAAVLSFAAFGEVQEPWRTVAALLCGTLALSSHGLKASSRLAINASPEPFSNWAASFGEDVFVAVLLWLAVKHPLAAAVVAGLVLVLAILLAAWIYRMLKRLFSRRPAVTAAGG